MNLINKQLDKLQVLVANSSVKLYSNFNLLVILLLLFLVAVCYYPGLTGGFIFDDEVNLIKNPSFIMADSSWQSLLSASFSSDSGPLKRPVAMLSFALNQYFTGLESTYAYKLTNIIIHALNGILVYFFLSQLFRAYQLVNQPLSLNGSNGISVITNQRILAAIIAALWLAHPLNLTSVLYIVQRMTSLSASFVLLTCICYIAGRSSMLAGQRKKGLLTLFLGCSSCYILAVFSKESGLITPLLIGLIEFAVFKCKKFYTFVNPQIIDSSIAVEGEKVLPRKRDELIIAWWMIFLLAIALVSVYFFYYKFTPLVETYNYRQFSLIERLLTESRVVFYYLGLILYPLNSHLGLYHDDIVISTSLTQPISTLYSLIAWALIMLALLLRLRKNPVIVALILWFVLGHLLESTIWPLELMHEHRNYLPMLSVLVLLAIASNALFVQVQVKSSVVKFISGIVIIVLAFSTHIRAGYWGNSLIHANFEVQHHPDSPRANYEAARAMYIAYLDIRQKEYYQAAIKLLDKSNSYPLAGMELGCFGKIFILYSTGQQMSEQEFQWCQQRLQSSPSLDINISKFDFILNEKSKGTLSISNDKIEQLFQAITANKFLNILHQAKIYSVIGTYYANILGDYENSRKFLVASLELNPQDINLYCIWIRYLIAVNQVHAAEQAIKSVEQHPQAWQYYNLLLPLKQSLPSKKMSN